jgi:hypothetical protein
MAVLEKVRDTGKYHAQYIQQQVQHRRKRPEQLREQVFFNDLTE